MCTYPLKLSCNPNQQRCGRGSCTKQVINFKKADWLSFQAQCSSELTEEAVMSAEDPAGQFTETQTQKVWKAIRKITGKGGCNSINHLKINGNLITDKKEVAEVF